MKNENQTYITYFYFGRLEKEEDARGKEKN